MNIKLLAAIFAMLLLTSCGAEKYQRFTADYPELFDSYMTVTGYAASREEFDAYAGIVYERLYRLHCLYDIYNDYEGITNLKTVNDNAGIAPVRVDGDIIELLEFGMEAYDVSGGVVNIAMGPVLRIWHDYREEAGSPGGTAESPPYETLQAAAGNTDIRGLVIDREEGTVFLKKPGMSLDVGAIAKGYAAREAVRAAAGAGMESVLVNMGGNVVAGGPPLSGRNFWAVGLQDPADTGGILDTVCITRSAVVTSGSYQRFYMVGGKAYNHIIDPFTLMPSERFASVTVVCDDSAVADMLSTSLFILPRAEGEKMLGRYGAEALWVSHDGSTQETAGFGKYRDSGR